MNRYRVAQCAGSVCIMYIIMRIDSKVTTTNLIIAYYCIARSVAYLFIQCGGRAEMTGYTADRIL